MRLSDELREMQGLCVYIKPDWVEHVERLERLACLVSEIELEMRTARVENERIREGFH